MNSSVINSSLLLNQTTPSSGRLPWYQFDVCKEAPSGFVFYYAVKVFNLVVGFPANMIVMWQVLQKKTDSSTSDIFIFNLAIFDAYFCLMTPIELVNRLLLNDDRIWYFQRFAYGIKDVTPLFLTCICLDRYVAVVHPIVFTGIRDNKIRVAFSLLVWALALAYALSKSIVGVDSTTSIFTGLILSAFIIMVFCNLSIIWVLRKSVVGKEEMHPMKKKAFRMVSIILAIIVFNYLPPVALFPFTAHYSFLAFKCQISVIAFSIMDLSCSIEPLLYMSKMEKMTGFANIPCSCWNNPSK
ncbi:P2Y purinoceptor 1-like [Megalops cyprinoides]|uniref:P2Y purinoceptor 1-like n=1 Tax=Megalops cyprinoides TaxID=118141 RepID=UPI001863DD9E|nr:P2Y purinoceptor 1-like [Megalops cyprinoides]